MQGMEPVEWAEISFCLNFFFPEYWIYMVNKPYHVSGKVEIYHGISKAKNTWIPYCETGDRTVLDVVDYLLWFFYFKGHKVVFEILKVLITKISGIKEMRYSTDYFVEFQSFFHLVGYI